MYFNTAHCTFVFKVLHMCLFWFTIKDTSLSLSLSFALSLKSIKQHFIFYKKKIKTPNSACLLLLTSAGYSIRAGSVSHWQTSVYATCVTIFGCLHSLEVIRWRRFITLLYREISENVYLYKYSGLKKVKISISFCIKTHIYRKSK